MSARRAAFASGLVLGAIGAVCACYTPPEPDCGFVCGAGDACPADYTCAADHICHRNGSHATCETPPPPFTVQSVAAATPYSVSITFDAVPDPGSIVDPLSYSIPGLSITSTPTLSGATVTLATTAQAAQTYTVTVVNVRRASDGAVLSVNKGTFIGIAACPQLHVASDGSGKQDLVISLIRPAAGGAVELYNTTAADIDLSTASYELVVPGATPLALSNVGSTIKANGYAFVTWQAAFGDESGGGELVLYGSSGRTPADIIDFTCWDSDAATPSALADAQTAGKWSTTTPACTGALVAGELVRRDATTGTLGNDYDPTATRAPLACP